jgi:hypothetical protein
MTLDFAQDLIEALDKEKQNYVLILSDPQIDDYRIYYSYNNDGFMIKSADLIMHTLREESDDDD